MRSVHTNVSFGIRIPFRRAVISSQSKNAVSASRNKSLISIRKESSPPGLPRYMGPKRLLKVRGIVNVSPHRQYNRGLPETKAPTKAARRPPTTAKFLKLELIQTTI